MKSKLFFLMMMMLILASPVFAQGTSTSNNYSTLSPFAMAIASGLCALAQGKAVASSAESIARNPGAGAGIRFALILGLVLIESLALYTLVIVFLRTA